MPEAFSKPPIETPEGKAETGQELLPKQTLVIETPNSSRAENVSIFGDNQLDLARRIAAGAIKFNDVHITQTAEQLDAVRNNPGARDYSNIHAPSSLDLGSIKYTKVEDDMRGGADYVTEDGEGLPIISVDLSTSRGTIGDPVMTTEKKLSISYNLGYSKDNARLERTFNTVKDRIFVETRKLTPANETRGVSATKWYHDDVPANERPAWMNNDEWDLRAYNNGGHEVRLMFNNTANQIKIMPRYIPGGSEMEYPSQNEIEVALQQAPQLFKANERYELAFGEYANQLVPGVKTDVPTSVSYAVQAQ